MPKEPLAMTQEQAERITKREVREMNLIRSEYSFLRFQVFQPEIATITLPNGQSATVTRIILLAFGSTWEKAVEMYQSRNR